MLYIFVEFLWIFVELFENREIHASVLAVFHKVGMRGEIVLLAVLEDEYPVFFQQLFFKYQIGNLCQFRKRIGRVGKDEVELLVA